MAKQDLHPAAGKLALCLRKASGLSQQNVQRSPGSAESPE
tara:strand:+ start:252 stop:371 length:120 start_codon:yes stop_codon:yes gene_type:complete